MTAKKYMFCLVCAYFFSSSSYAMPLIPTFSKVDNKTGIKTYDITFKTFEHQRSEVLQTYLNKNNLSNNDLIPFAKGLSSFVEKFNNTPGKSIFPNCFNSSLASIVTSFWHERFMSTSEFVCQLKNYAYPVSNWEFGDIAVLSTNGSPAHAMTYLGWNINNPSDHFVFSKLGYDVSTKYLVTTLEDMFRLYKSHDLQFYRLRYLSIPDPAVYGKSSACYNDYVQHSKDFGLIDYDIR